MKSIDESLRKAFLPAQLALKYHPFYRGKIEIGIFRGTIDVRAKTITDEMCLAAANELARLAEERGLTAKNIIPTMDDWEVFPREATGVADKAIDQGVVRIKHSRDEIYADARAIIKRAREETKFLMRSGFIQARHSDGSIRETNFGV